MKEIMKQNKFLHTLESCWLCLRFPFLYTRNRFNGKHWTSWKMERYLYGTPADFKLVKDGDTYKREITNPAKPGVFDKAYERVPKPNRKYNFETVDKVKSIPWVIWYYIVNATYYFISIFHIIPTFTELDMMEPGWRNAFGIQMCKELRRQLIKDHYLFKYRITQIKEKWGYLHWYDAGASKEVHDIISKYEDISWNTCLVCGKPSTKISSGWISPYCDDCYPQDKLVYEEKMPDGTWQETEEYRKRMEELDKEYEK